MSNLLGDLPRLFPRPEQTIAGIGRLLRQGELNCADLLLACVEQYEDRESRVRAWVVFDRERAMRQAWERDAELRKGKDRGALHGIPIGVKDIIDVEGFPTLCGARQGSLLVAERDARVVARLRQAGAVILGKTVTTAHAWIDPPPTRNPWNRDRTPGGSSSGSAAAVATGMCYGAIGSQTGGSITRPASFCGVAGLKPSYGWSLAQGVSPLAPSLDHVGPIARGVEDLQLLFSAMVALPFSMQSSALEKVFGSDPPRIGRPRGFFDRRADPAVTAVIEDAVRILTARGAKIVDLDDPVDFEAVLLDHRRVMAAEAAAVHADSLESTPDEYPPRIRDLIIEGRWIRAMEYIQSRNRWEDSRARVEDAMDREKVLGLLTPATVSTATDVSTTGDPAFNSPWSYVRLPTVSIPVGLASDHMPVALQLVGRNDGDARLLLLGRWCEEAIHTSRR